MLDQADALRQMMAGNYKSSKSNDTKKAKIITVTSGKGGVGKSNFVVNMAIALKKKGKKVLVFDADIGMGNDDVLMGIYPKSSVFDVLEGKEIEDIIEEGPEGIYLLAGGSGINRIEDLNDNERNNFLDKLQALDDFDYILMDTGAGINRSVLAFMASSEELIVIITPEPTALTDAYSLIKAADHFNIKEKIDIVVNRALDNEEGVMTFNKFNTAVSRFLSVRVEYLGCILDDRRLIQSVRNQVPVIINYPNSDSSKCILDISEKVAGYADNTYSKSNGIKGLFNKIFNIFSD